VSREVSNALLMSENADIGVGLLGTVDDDTHRSGCKHEATSLSPQ
jgi:hypothetical protein